MTVKIDCAYDQLVEVEKLVPHPRNNNRHSIEQIEALAKLIKAHGFRHALVVSNRSGFIVAGHGRLEAARKLGIEKLPVDFQDFSSEAEEYQCLTADNEIARWAELDYQNIYDTLKELPDVDVSLLGIEDFKLPEEEVIPQCDEDEVPEAPPIPKTKRGDIFELGNHRLMCGDSTMIDDVEKLMNGEKADMVFTDPPYGVSYTGGLGDSGNGLTSNKREMIKNDDMDLYYDAVVTANHFSNGPVFMFYADTVPFELYRAVKEVGAKVIALLIWKKKGGYGALGASYKQNHEPCLIWLPKGKNINFIGDSSENRIWEIDKDGLNKMHPTQKPVSIPKRAISNHKCEVVLDIFGGSGSTMIASEELGKKSRLMELDEKYCDVIINRWQKYTGKKAYLLKDNEKIEFDSL